MAIRRLSEECWEADGSCNGIWDDDEYPQDVTAVGKLLDPSPVPLREGEAAAIRISRRVIRDARIVNEMDLDDLRRIGSAAKKSAFRFETLPQYLVPQEAKAFADWKAGKPLPPRTPENDETIARLQRDAARGLRRYRVHILDQPLTPYLRFELYLYLDSIAVGSEVYVADRDDHPALAELHEDFWLYDDEIRVRMIYDEEGHFLYPELIEDLEPYRQMRDIAMRTASP
jgi:hypothetical protein